MKRAEDMHAGLKEARELLNGAHAVRKHRERVYEIRERLVPLALENRISEKMFYTLATLLKSQAYSAILKNYFIAKVGAEKTKARSGKGDLVWNKIHYIYKVSAFNENKALHAVQVRLQQKCDYIIQYTDEKHLPPVTFRLTRERMKKELELCNASSAHGTMGPNRASMMERELRFTIDTYGNNWRRWTENYKLSNGELVK